MERRLRRFLRNRRGAFAIQFALMVVPLVACTGVAIDGGRAFLARYELGAALDAAALAVGSTVDEDQDALEAVARRFVNRNFQLADPNDIVLSLDPQEEMITLQGRIALDTVFMPIVGISTIDVSAESEVRRGGTNVEVALVLDTTGSMSGQRMTDLKSAARDLVDIVVTDKQEPYFAKLALISYGDNVNAGAYADAVRGAPRGGKSITDADWRVNGSAYVSAAVWKDGGTKSISSVTRASQAEVTANNHGFSNGDVVYITSVKGMRQLNDKAYRVADASSNKFKLKDRSSGAYVRSSSFSKYKSAGTLQKCLTGDCEVRVTASNHRLSNGDFAHIDGAIGMTHINNDDDETWIVADATNNTFILKDSWGPSSSSYSGNAYASECYTASCEVRVESSRHGLSNGDWAYITNVRGMSINTSGDNAWRIKDATSDTFILQDSVGPSYANYSGSGTAWCLEDGCQYLRFTSASGSTRIQEISSCVSERIGANAYTGVAPSTATVGRAYSGGGYTGCRSYAAFEPLTAARESLKTKISRLDTDDSTAGHIGLAWGWYMLAPDWGYLWPDDENKPLAYRSNKLAKVLVLMTDGDFNTAYCNSVVSKNYGVGSSSDRINCNATNGDPFTQAANLCSAIKSEGVIIYTVGFGGDLSNGGGAFLRGCATSPKHAYMAVTGEELRTAFSAIARSISLLRLSR
jgi:Flp pilus assembly protein TadG